MDLRLGQEREYPRSVSTGVDYDWELRHRGYLLVEAHEIVRGEGLRRNRGRVELEPGDRPAVLERLYLRYHYLPVDVLCELFGVPVRPRAHLSEPGEGVG